MQIQTDGIVIKETNVGESDKYVTILTSNHGTLEAYVKGARRKGSRLDTPTSLFCYSSFELFKSNTRYYVDQADINQLFYDIRLDLKRLSIASYFCQVIYEIKPDADTCQNHLKLLLNSIYLLSKAKKDPRIVKAVFELRTMVLSGLCPDVVACKKCAEFDKRMRFYIQEGSLLCQDCALEDGEGDNAFGYAVITPSVLAAMRHIIFAEPEKVFSFTLDEENLILLGQVCESYLLCQTERSYRSLDFLKTITD